jgi:hypothetical protein
MVKYVALWKDEGEIPLPRSENGGEYGLEAQMWVFELKIADPANHSRS